MDWRFAKHFYENWHPAFSRHLKISTSTAFTHILLASLIMTDLIIIDDTDPNIFYYGNWVSVRQATCKAVPHTPSPASSIDSVSTRCIDLPILQSDLYG